MPVSQPFVPRPWQHGMIEHALDHRRCALWAKPGLGKQQPDSEPVLTPSGWVPMGDLRAGDFVVGADGRPTQVLATFPQGEQETVRVTFTDGAWCNVGWEHLWYVQRPSQKKTGNVGHVLTTRQMVDFGLTKPSGTRGEDTYWYIPMVEPVQFPCVDLPMEPYLLGVILGDGSVTKEGRVRLCTDTETFAECGAKASQRHETCEYVSNGSVGGVAKTMVGLGLNGKRSWEKFVPPAYLHASVEQRLALLQGLLDTDGSPMDRGGVEFSSTAEALADAVIELAQSLGGVARKAGPRITRYQNGEGRPSWRVNVKLPLAFEPFRLQRKLARWVPPLKYPPIRKIVSAEVTGREHATCIKVAAADSLYVTRNYVVTHNTGTILSVLDSHFMSGEDHPALILAPLRVARRTWARESQKWDDFSHLDVVPIVGTVKERLAAMRQDAPIFTTNYENLVWLTEHWGDRWPYRIIVADESTKLKSLRLSFQKSKKGKEFLNGQGGKRARALGKIAHMHATHFYELTGTPSPNGLADLWGQLWFLDGGRRLGRTFEAFKQRWFRPKYNGFGIEPLPHAEAQIYEAVKDICMTVDGADWLDLKEPVVNIVKVDLPPNARRIYRDIEKEMFAEIGDRTVEAFNAAAKTQKALQCCNGSVYVDPLVESDDNPRSKEWREVHDEKLQALDELLSEMSGNPVIVVYEFRSDLARLLKAFPEGRVLKTDADEADFKAGKIPYLFVHPQSGGHGIDGFQYVCHEMVFFGNNWNLEYHDQIVERIGPVRQMQAGFDRPVYLHYIVAENTVDELVMERRQTKRDVQDLLMEAAKRRR